jgi:hypothetical protein
VTVPKLEIDFATGAPTPGGPPQPLSRKAEKNLPRIPVSSKPEDQEVEPEDSSPDPPDVKGKTKVKDEPPIDPAHHAEPHETHHASSSSETSSSSSHVLDTVHAVTDHPVTHAAVAGAVATGIGAMMPVSGTVMGGVIAPAIAEAVKSTMSGSSHVHPRGAGASSSSSSSAGTHRPVHHTHEPSSSGTSPEGTSEHGPGVSLTKLGKKVVPDIFSDYEGYLAKSNRSSLTSAYKSVLEEYEPYLYAMRSEYFVTASVH